MESTPRAYRLKASNAAPPFSTSAGTSPGILDNHISFGNGAHDFVEVAAVINASVTLTANTSGKADFALTVGTLHAPYTIGEISGNVITFGNGDGDFVEIPGVSLTIRASGHTSGTGEASATTEATIDLSKANITDNQITFGNGNGDFVSAIADLSGNTISFGNGNNDHVSMNPSLGDSSNNTITMGNGTGDSVALNAGDGGDTIITGKGLDTVNVGTHTHADTFGFAKGTDGTAFTTITGAKAGDHIISDNNLGTNVINSETTATTLADFIASLSGNPNGKTFVGYNDTAPTHETFIVSNHGAVELLGVAFMNSQVLTDHILTLA
jgi:hypothetical protein